MGLDASVRCRCWEEGGTTEPPFPREWLVVDEEGLVSLAPAHVADDRLWALIDWTRSCCPHPGMNLHAGSIGEWDAVESFRGALARTAGDRCALLLAEIPLTNGGAFPADLAELALDELRDVEAEATEAGFANVVGALRRALEASVETGHPVRWT